MKPRRKFKRPAEYVTVSPCGGAAAKQTRPNNNMGLAGTPTPSKGHSLCIDYCSFSFSEEWAESMGLHAQQCVEWLFPGCSMVASEHERKTWQFYTMSSYIHGPDGTLVGRVGSGGNRGTICVSLSGAGCALVQDWLCTMVQARRLRARLTRLDVAFDDFESAFFPTIRDVNTWALEGSFNPPSRGQSCATRFMDDHNKGKGSTVYVGSRGKKQLCIYEKGKQLGDPESKWIRCELRLWSTDVVIPLEALSMPGAYLRGAYALLQERLPAVAEETAKPERVQRAVKATAEAAVKFLRQQCGPTLHLFVKALGPDVWDLFNNQVFREAIPRRFRGMTPSLSVLRSIVREQIATSRSLPSFVA